MIDRLLKAAALTIENSQYCWILTVANDGSINARPMGKQKVPVSDDPFCSIFLTRRGTRKADEITSSSHVSVTYQHDATDSYVTLVGSGTIVTDRQLLRASWLPRWNQFFPGGADDDDAMLIQFSTDRIELWARGLTSEPFGRRGAILERESKLPWRLLQA